MTKGEITEAADFYDGDDVWIIVRRRTNNAMILRRVNIGFNTVELLGLAHMTSLDIQKQMSGEIKPDIIERQIIVDEKE
jgi:hypothetical protein